MFPVCDEEPELEGDSSYGTDDHSPRHLNTQDSGTNYTFLPFLSSKTIGENRKIS